MRELNTNYRQIELKNTKVGDYIYLNDAWWEIVLIRKSTADEYYLEIKCMYKGYTSVNLLDNALYYVKRYFKVRT